MGTGGREGGTSHAHPRSHFSAVISSDISQRHLAASSLRNSVSPFDTLPLPSLFHCPPPPAPIRPAIHTSAQAWPGVTAPADERGDARWRERGRRGRSDARTQTRCTCRTCANIPATQNTGGGGVAAGLQLINVAGVGFFGGGAEVKWDAAAVWRR